MTKGMAWHSGNAWQVKHCSQHYNTPTALPQLWYEGKIFTNSTSLPLRKENQRTLLRALHYITCCTFYKFSEIHTSEDSWPHSFLLSMFNFLFLSSVFGEAIFSIRKNSKWQGTPCQETAGGRCMPAELMDHPSTTPAPGPSLHPPHQHLDHPSIHHISTWRRYLRATIPIINTITVKKSEIQAWQSHREMCHLERARKKGQKDQVEHFFKDYKNYLLSTSPQHPQRKPTLQTDHRGPL